MSTTTTTHERPRMPLPVPSALNPEVLYSPPRRCDRAGCDELAAARVVSYSPRLHELERKALGDAHADGVNVDHLCREHALQERDHLQRSSTEDELLQWAELPCPLPEDYTPGNGAAEIKALGWRDVTMRQVYEHELRTLATESPTVQAVVLDWAAELRRREGLSWPAAVVAAVVLYFG